MVRQLQTNTTACIYIFKIFAKFFLLFIHCFLLSESLSVHFLWCGLVPIHIYWFLCSRSLALALWTWLSGLTLCLLLSICLQVPVLLPGSALVLVPWFPWLVKWCSIIPARMSMCFWPWALACQLLAGGKIRVMEQHVVGDRLGLLLMGDITVLVYCSICSWSLNIIYF